MPTASQLAIFIKHAAAEAGFDLAGVAPVAEFGELQYFPQWIREQRHGDLRYMESREEHGELKRASLRSAAPWAKSVVACAMSYDTAQPYSTEVPHDGRTGWISRYAWAQHDYHDVVLPRLREIERRLRGFAGEVRTWCYVDTGPLVERVYAKYAGIGWIGKNTCIINQKLGSWLFLGVILTSVEIQPDLPPPDRCGTCRRCIEACPTDAFIEPYKLDASRCISYLTIEKRGAIPEDLREGVGRHVFGCDICQDVCPWNRRGADNQPQQRDGKGAVPRPADSEFQPRPQLVNPSLEWLATISAEDFQAAFRGSPIKRTKRSGLRRNAVVAMGNSGNSEFIPMLSEIAEHDSDENVAEHARWALKQLLRPSTKT